MQTTTSLILCLMTFFSSTCFGEESQSASLQVSEESYQTPFGENDPRLQDLLMAIQIQDALYELQVQNFLAESRLKEEANPSTSDEPPAQNTAMQEQPIHHIYDNTHLIVVLDETTVPIQDHPLESQVNDDSNFRELCNDACNPCDSGRCDDQWQNDPWSNPVRFYFDHVEGRWFDDDRGYTSFGMFAGLPNVAGCFTPIIDIREHYSNHGKYATNVGLGLRYGDEVIFGVNGFYDYRKGDFASYNQVGLGFEVLSPCLDFRLNSYFPVGDHDGASKLSVFNNFSNPNFFATCQEFQGAMAGGDAEIGRWLKCMDCCSCFDLYAGLGMHYYQSRSKKHEHTYGVEARLASRIGRYLTFEVSAGYDKLYHGMMQGRLTVTYPISDLLSGGALECLSSCCDIACGCFCPATLQPIQRQEYIVLGKKTCCWEWNWDNGGERSCSDCSSSSSSSSPHSSK